MIKQSWQLFFLSAQFCAITLHFKKTILLFKKRFVSKNYLLKKRGSLREISFMPSGFFSQILSFFSYRNDLRKYHLFFTSGCLRHTGGNYPAE